MYPANPFMRDFPPSGSTPDDGLLIVVVVSYVVLIVFSFLACSFAISFPTTLQSHEHKVKVHFIMEGNKEDKDVTLVSALRGIAGWRFALRSRTDWLSLTIWTFWGESYVWIICNVILIAFISD